MSVKALLGAPQYAHTLLHSQRYAVVLVPLPGFCGWTCTVFLRVPRGCNTSDKHFLVALIKESFSYLIQQEMSLKTIRLVGEDWTVTLVSWYRSIL